MDESREVEYVRPEEDAPGGARAEREAEEPLERRRLRASPKPPCLPDFSRGGEEDAGEDRRGDDRHGEAVDCRNGTQ